MQCINILHFVVSRNRLIKIGGIGTWFESLYMASVHLSSQATQVSKRVIHLEGFARVESIFHVNTYIGLIEDGHRDVLLVRGVVQRGPEMHGVAEWEASCSIYTLPGVYLNRDFSKCKKM